MSRLFHSAARLRVSSQAMRSVLSMPRAVVENLRSAVYASYEELSAQVQADSALDAKLLGLLGFLAGAGSEAAYLTRLLTDLAVTTRVNHQGLEFRRRALVCAVGSLVLLTVAYAMASVVR
jgi:hypothetical protein